MFRNYCEDCCRETDHDRVAGRPTDARCVGCGRVAPIRPPAPEFKQGHSRRSTLAAVIGLVTGAIVCGPVAFVFMQSCARSDPAGGGTVIQTIIVYLAILGYLIGPFIGWAVAWGIEAWIVGRRLNSKTEG
jgi:hypothetical protein